MGTVWDRTIEFIGDNLAVILPIAIFAMVIPSSVQGSLTELHATGSASLRLTLALLALAFALLAMWAQLAIAALAIDPSLGRDAAGVASRRLLPAIGVYLVLLIAVAVVIVVAIFALSAIGYDFGTIQASQVTLDGSQIPAAMFGRVALLVLVVALALVVLLARLAPLPAVIVAERRGLGAIARAFRLTRGLTWRLIGVIVLYVVVASVAGMAAQTVFGSVMRIIAGGEGPVTVAGVVTSVVVAAVSSAFAVLASAFAAKLYVAAVGAQADADGTRADATVDAQP